MCDGFEKCCEISIKEWSLSANDKVSNVLKFIYKRIKKTIKCKEIMKYDDFFFPAEKQRRQLCLKCVAEELHFTWSLAI